MRRLLALALVFVSLTQFARADDRVTGFTLDNGLEVVVIEDHRAPVVVHMLWYRVGSADEPPGASGIAHFLEHLMFKATDTLDVGEFSSVVARNGGRDNAFTSYDYTAYFQRIAADRLGLMMQMEADRMANLRLTPDVVATERDVVIEERNQVVESSPRAIFREQMNAAMFLNHRYGVPIIGWMHEIETLDKQKALDFYGRFYTPENAILIVAGAVTPQEVQSLAEAHYGAIPARGEMPPRLRAQEPPQRAERRLIYRDARVAQPVVQRAYHAPARRSGDQAEAAALTILAEALGSPTTGLLAQRLEFDSQAAVFTGAWYGSTALDGSSFNLIVAPSEGVTPQQAEAAMDEVLRDLLQDGIDPDHLARIMMQVRASEIYGRDSAESTANRYGRALTQGLTIADVQAWPAALQAVTEEDVLAAARKVLDLRQSVTGWLLSDDETELTQ